MRNSLGDRSTVGHRDRPWLSSTVKSAVRGYSVASSWCRWVHAITSAKLCDCTRGRLLSTPIEPIPAGIANGVCRAILAVSLAYSERRLRLERPVGSRSIHSSRRGGLLARAPLRLPGGKHGDGVALLPRYAVERKPRNATSLVPSSLPPSGLPLARAHADLPA
jgi:hypothetical protein